MWFSSTSRLERGDGGGTKMIQFMSEVSLFGGRGHRRMPEARQQLGCRLRQWGGLSLLPLLEQLPVRQLFHWGGAWNLVLARLCRFL